MRALVHATLILAAAAIGYCLYFQWATSDTDALVSRQDQGLNWVRIEFGLDDAEFAALEKSNDEFTPRCAAMCAELSQARADLASLIGGKDSDESELAATRAKIKDIEQRCHLMTVEHIDEVSQLMKPAAGERYRTQMTAALAETNSDHHKLHEAANAADK